jgi:hypothetical protein
MKKLGGICAVVGLWLVGGCDGLTDGGYRGEPLATVRGSVSIQPGSRPNDTLQALLLWNVESLVDYKVDQGIALTSQNLGTFFIDLFVPPPDQALNTDPETGGKLGFASFFVYDDPRGEGPVDLSKVKPEDYSKLVYRLRGGAENVMLAYARDAFPAGTRIATALGQAIEPGFYLVRFDGDCFCYFVDDGRCHASNGQSCSIKDMTVTLLPVDAEIDLTIVDDYTEYRTVHSPDWLFL